MKFCKHTIKKTKFRSDFYGNKIRKFRNIS
nr:MAG TPA: hypothetical protein [Caudoviricetes sp.]